MWVKLQDYAVSRVNLIQLFLSLVLSLLVFPNFVRLPDCERVDKRGDVDPHAGQTGSSPWSDLP